MFKIVPIDSQILPTENINFIALLERYFTACLYCYINKNENFVCNIDSIIKTLEIRYKKENMVPNEKFVDNCQIYSDYKNEQLPYYIIECSIPFHIPALDGSYEINFIDNVKSVKITRVSHNINTDYELHYTRFKIQFYGFINASGDWHGPNIESPVELYNTHKAVKVINEFLILMSKIDNNNYYPRVYVEQIETHICSQFQASGKLCHYCNFTNFGSGGIYTPPRSKLFNDEQNKNFKHLLCSKHQLPLYEKLLLLSKNDISVGLYTEAFMLLNSTLESMIYFFTKGICIKLNIAEKLQEFERPKSRCDSCNLIKDINQNSFEMAPKLPPSIFNYPNFLYNINSIDKKKVQFTKKFNFNS